MKKKKKKKKKITNNFLKLTDLVALKWHLLIALCSLALFLKKLYFPVPCCSWFVPHRGLNALIVSRFG